MRRSKRKSTREYASSKSKKSSRPRQGLPDIPEEEEPLPGSSASGMTQRTTDDSIEILYTREDSSVQKITVPVVSSSIPDKGINQHTQINLIQSIHATMGSNVSLVNKNKIINGEYIDLSTLVESKLNQEKQEKQVVMVDGVLLAKQKITR